MTKKIVAPPMNMNILEAQRHIFHAKVAASVMSLDFNEVRDMQKDICNSLGRMEHSYHNIAVPPDKTLLNMNTIEERYRE
jgi:hypothetical protein